LPLGVFTAIGTFANKYGLSWHSLGSIEFLVYLVSNVGFAVLGGYLFGVMFWKLSGREPENSARDP
jgi:hypothetical protein